MNWHQFLKSVFDSLRLKWTILRSRPELWRIVRLILPLLLLALILNLTEWLQLEGWRERVGQAVVLAYSVFLALILVLTALGFAQRHGWLGLLFWKTLYFACATVFIGLGWTIIACVEGYQLRWIHLVFWMLLGQAAAWFGIMVHLLVEES